MKFTYQKYMTHPWRRTGFDGWHIESPEGVVTERRRSFQVWRFSWSWRAQR